MWKKRCENWILVSKPEDQTKHLEDAGVNGKIMLQ
jgi:hypothetical protein